MKINYNNWFYEFYKYTTGIRGTNDTSWKDIQQRYQTLIKMRATLLEQQPYSVLGNERGFEKLLDLMSKSNYQFQDVNDALKKTYELSLQNAMGKTMVNTHAVIFYAENIHDPNIHHVSASAAYFVVDVPYDQMHFGERDEFIRQKLHRMHDSVNEQYLHISEFTDTEFTKILGCTFLCSIDGKICNEFYVGFDDQGLKFKFGYGKISDVEVIIYKLDDTMIRQCTIPKLKFDTSDNQIHVSPVWNHSAGKTNSRHNCIVDIYLGDYQKTMNVVPNFGVLTEDGELVIAHPQQATLDMLDEYHPDYINMIIYCPKHLHEVDGVYPALNYLDMADNRGVYTDLENPVKNVDDHTIVATEIHKVRNTRFPICTPPICLDRVNSLQFEEIIGCANLYDDLMNLTPHVTAIGSYILRHPSSSVPKGPVDELLNDVMGPLFQHLRQYMNGAMLMAITDTELCEEFTSFCKMLQDIRDASSNENWLDLVDKRVYPGEYELFVERICKPFVDCEQLQFFHGIPVDECGYQFYDAASNPNRFNRPISEQCFLALQYSREQQAWLFASPNIRHFHGIENTFYIDQDLTGRELFRFFVLYTDTEAPSAKEIDDTFEINTVLDYDLFIQETERHLGFIRYWEKENKLMKLSKVIHNQYSDECVLDILSKILRHEIDAKDILSQYPSEMGYSDANVTTDHWDDYTPTSERAPFSINYLFYTLSMLQNNEDRLQAYFYHILTDEKFDARYLDYQIAKATENQPKLIMNFSKIGNPSQTMLLTSDSRLTNDSNVCLYYGFPGLIQNKTLLNRPYYYPFSFVSYERNQKYPLIQQQTINPEYYIYRPYNNNSWSYYYDIQVAKACAKYLNYVRDMITYLETDYKLGVNQTFAVESYIESLQKSYDPIATLLEQRDAYQNNLTASMITLLQTEQCIPFLKKLLKHYEAIQYDFHWRFGTAGWKQQYSTKGSQYQNLYQALGWWLRTFRYMYFVHGFQNHTIRRVRGIYIHIKKYYQTPNVYQFKQLHLHYDKEFMKEDIQASVTPLQGDLHYPFTYAHTLSLNERDTVSGFTNNLEDIANYDTLKNELDTIKRTYVKKIEDFIDDIVQHEVFDLYVIDTIQPSDHSSESVVVDGKPAYAIWEITRDASHPQFCMPSQSVPNDTKWLYFAMRWETRNGQTILQYDRCMIKHCEYTFFDGTKLTNQSFHVFDESGQSLMTLQMDVTFQRVGNTSDLLPDMELLLNNRNTTVDLPNVHEKHQEVEEHGLTKMTRVTNTNYEMLLANRYRQLDHHYEMTLQRKTYQPSPIDRVYIQNQAINQFLLTELGARVGAQMFYKPSQILHCTIGTDDSINEIGGKFTEGQKIYLVTNDDLHYLFPAYVTAITHSQSKGFVEAKVDHRHAKWFEITDKTMMTKYLTTDVECIALDDNYVNFLDEFNHSEYLTYPIPTFDPDLEYTDENYEGLLSVPGDPVYVQNNADYVYTRLNYFFHEDVRNRFLDDSHKRWRFLYMGWNQVFDTSSDIMTVYLLNHNLCGLTDPELYPILRDEPNDHDVHLLEDHTFRELIAALDSQYERVDSGLEYWYWELHNADTEYKKQEAQQHVTELERKRDKIEAFQTRVQSYLDNPETLTNWHNVISYDTAMVYLHNNRTKPPYAFKVKLQDIPFTDELQIFLFDWEHKQWIDPSSYTITKHMEQHSTKDVYWDYTVRDVMRTIDIYPTETFPTSKQILIYFAYAVSDVFDEIPLNDNKCLVRFKPILSTNNNIPDDLDEIKTNMYDQLRIRKHLDLEESYHYDIDMTEDGDLNGSLIGQLTESEDNEQSTYNFIPSGSFSRFPLIHRGDHPYTPKPRFCHMDVYITAEGQEQSIHETANEYHIMIKNPFPDTSTFVQLSEESYEATIVQSIDNFRPGEHVKLICISQKQSKYNGNISSIMFDAITGLYDYEQTITILRSTANVDAEGSYTCTIAHDASYACSGGLINVTITRTQTIPEYITDDGSWYLIPNKYLPYMEIPNEFLLIPQHGYEASYACDVKISVTYKKSTDDTIMEDNSGMMNPFEFYYDPWNFIRYPISDTRFGDPHLRLTNPPDDLKLVQTNHLHVCRYSLSRIPKNGLIDVTGFVPTPLSRKRYEWWVNGRQLMGTDNLIILSPTSFQLLNLTSLKNFELIELVDDMYENTLSNKAPIYIDLEGNVFSTYQQAILSTHEILSQSIQYTFYGFPNHTKLQNTVVGFIDNPNNYDLEKDIMENWKKTDETDYNKLYNTPTINGVSIYHPITDDLGLYELPNEKILESLDQVWKYERLTNPLFAMTHLDSSMIRDQQYLLFHVKEEDDHFVVYTTETYSHYFTLYVSDDMFANIENLDHTIKVIPLIRTGVRITLDKKYKGMWLHATIQNENPIKIQ